jgi:HSP20 family molecular chaperone IbpA
MKRAQRRIFNRPRPAERGKICQSANSCRPRRLFPYHFVKRRAEDRASVMKCQNEGFDMSRLSPFSSPLLLGFDEIERALDRVTKTAGDGYPPYNIERLTAEGAPERLRITLAVAGFSREQIEIVLEENHLVIKGRQIEDKDRHYLHRGIAARQFQRTFLLVEGIEVKEAVLENGLLSIDLVRPEPQRVQRRIEITHRH